MFEKLTGLLRRPVQREKADSGHDNLLAAKKRDIDGLGPVDTSATNSFRSYELPGQGDQITHRHLLDPAEYVVVVSSLDAKNKLAELLEREAAKYRQIEVIVGDPEILDYCYRYYVSGLKVLENGNCEITFYPNTVVSVNHQRFPIDRTMTNYVQTVQISPDDSIWVVNRGEMTTSQPSSGQSLREKTRSWFAKRTGSESEENSRDQEKSKAYAIQNNLRLLEAMFVYPPKMENITPEEEKLMRYAVQISENRSDEDGLSFREKVIFFYDTQTGALVNPADRTKRPDATYSKLETRLYAKGDYRQILLHTADDYDGAYTSDGENVQIVLKPKKDNQPPVEIKVQPMRLYQDSNKFHPISLPQPGDAVLIESINQFNIKHTVSIGQLGNKQVVVGR